MNSKYRDIIDAEYFFHLDRQQEWKDLHRRDRDIFLHEENQFDKTTNPSLLLSTWIKTQRKVHFKEADSFGTIVAQSIATTRIFLVTLALFLGISGSTAYLSYSGNTPINIFAFLLFFIGPQLFFITVTTIVQMLRIFSPRYGSNTVSLITRYTFQKITSFFSRSLLPHLSAEHRLCCTHVLGNIQQKKGYGFNILNLLRCIHQSAAISFNIGLILGALFKISTTDIAFGWQSTLQLSNNLVYTLVNILSTPWNWHWYLAATTPTLEEIAGSHIVLKEGIYHLSTQNLSSWWPFLILCLITYGLMPRIILYGWARSLEIISLQKSSLQTPEYQKLLHRMRTPIFNQRIDSNVSSQQNPANEHTEANNNLATMQKQPTDQQVITDSHAVLLFPADISTTNNKQTISTWLGQLGYKIDTYYTFMDNYEADQQLVEQLATASWDTNSTILIVMEAHMVPLTEFSLYLQAIRTRTHTLIEIILVGNERNGVLTKPKESDIALWRKKVTGIGDNFITIFPSTFQGETP